MIKKCIFRLCGAMLAGLSAASCSMMEQNLDDCPIGLHLTFKYDYNLQRADMFPDHVGAVTVYVFDTDGRYITKQEEANLGSYRPLASHDYTMRMNLPAGKYKFIVLGGQKPYEEMLADGGAGFVRQEPGRDAPMTDLQVQLDHLADVGGGHDFVPHDNQPLDTLWHGMQWHEAEVFDTKPTYDTVSLVRDTKEINVTLRALDYPGDMDIDKYDLKIIDRNTHLLWDNSLREDETVVYTPYATWNTLDRTSPGTSGTLADVGAGRIAHADFMTSRILYHDDPADDAILSVTNRDTGVEVIRINLADMLARMRTGVSTHRYAPQEFLDRAYDYSLSFYLKGDTWAEVELRISILSWSMRLQNENVY